MNTTGRFAFKLAGLVLALGVLPRVASAACTEPTANSDLVMVLEEATTAFGKLEIEDFNAAASRATEVILCLDEPISRPSAAEYHRVQGIALFLSRNSPAAQKSFASARSVESDYSFPTDLVPEGNPIRADYEALDPKVGPFELANPPKSGSLRLNGSRSMNRAVPLPVIFQQLDGRGAIVQTALVEGGAALPTYATGSNKPGKAPKEAGSGPSKPLLLGAVVGLVAAGGLYGGALATKGSFNSSNNVAGLAGKRSTANALSLAAGGLGLVSVGLGTTSFLVSGTF